MKNTVALIALALGLTLSASAEIIYDSIPNPDPAGMPSLGYQATSTDEFGDYIAFSPGSGRALESVRVGMVSWAEYDADYTSGGAAYTDPNLSFDLTGWDQELTFNIYSVDNSGATPDVGSLLATMTDTFHIPWAPGNGTHPFAPVTFDFSSLGVVLPDEVIFGLAFDTRSYGANPTGYIGPYDSLNFGVNSLAPTVGTDVEPDALFWDTSHGPFYADGGAAGVDVFRRDTDWSPYTPAVEFNVADAPVPEPATVSLLGLGLAGFVIRRYGAKKRA